MARLPRLLAPREDDSLLAWPALSAWPALAETNRSHRKRVSQGQSRIGGLPLAEWRLLQGLPDPDLPRVVAGHQPEPFHFGVWTKNFAIARLAEHVGARATFVITHHDACRSATIWVPSGTPIHPLLAAIELDHGMEEVPWELRPVVDAEAIGTLEARIADNTRAFTWQSMVAPFTRQLENSASEWLGDRIGQGRRYLEREFFGIANEEVGFVELARSAAFRRLLAECLLRAGEFAQTHNALLAEYRGRYRIRSRHHPVTDLGSEREWIETPFWVYGPDDPYRRPLWIRPRRSSLVLSDRPAWTPAASMELPIRPSGGMEEQIAGLAEQLRDELLPWWIRPRALLTTLFLRLAVADLFIHGIGGARYDELTDALICRFFGFEPPPYAVVTSTLWLPFATKAFDARRLQETARMRRDLDWNPERYLEDDLIDRAPVARFLSLKEEAARMPERTRAERLARWKAFREANAGLRPFVSVQRERAAAKLEELFNHRSAEEILQFREFPFFLHDPARIADFFGRHFRFT